MEGVLFLLTLVRYKSSWCLWDRAVSAVALNQSSCVLSEKGREAGEMASVQIDSLPLRARRINSYAVNTPSTQHYSQSYTIFSLSLVSLSRTLIPLDLPAVHDSVWEDHRVGWRHEDPRTKCMIYLHFTIKLREGRVENVGRGGKERRKGESGFNWMLLAQCLSKHGMEIHTIPFIYTVLSESIQTPWL